MAIIVKNNIEFDIMESLRCAVDNVLVHISIKVNVSTTKSIIGSCIYIYRQPDSKIKAFIDIIVIF